MKTKNRTSKHKIEVCGTWRVILKCNSVSDYNKKLKAIEKFLAESQYNPQTDYVDYGPADDYENEKDWKRFLNT